jgi:hypothetical protein
MVFFEKKRLEIRRLSVWADTVLAWLEPLALCAGFSEAWGGGFCKSTVCLDTFFWGQVSGANFSRGQALLGLMGLLFFFQGSSLF